MPLVPSPAEHADRARRLVSEHASRQRRRPLLRARAVDLLQERRQALITAAVTGQIEIPGVAA